MFDDLPTCYWYARMAPTDSNIYRYTMCCVPYCSVFIIRSLTTLDFCAVRTGANMYELAAPTALFRAMAPKTARGRAQLEKTLLAGEA